MRSSLEGYPRRDLLILDTGPIRELVTFHAVEQLGFESLRRHLKFIKDRESYQLCTQFIQPFRKKMTSAAIVVELHYWIRDTDSTGRRRLWNRVYEEFQGMSMSEEMVRLVDMDVGLVTRLGPVDISLWKLAQRHAADNPVLLTVEDELQGECKRAGIDVRHIREVMPMAR